MYATKSSHNSPVSDFFVHVIIINFKYIHDIYPLLLFYIRVCLLCSVESVIGLSDSSLYSVIMYIQGSILLLYFCVYGGIVV